MHRAARIAGLLALTTVMVSVVQAQVAPLSSIQNTSYYTSMMPPFNKTIIPQGTFTLANNVTLFEIQVEIGSVDAKGVFTATAGTSPRTASNSEDPKTKTRTWSAASYQNLTGGQRYAIRATLNTATGNPPGKLAFAASATTDIPVP
jgi:hypothetical protein